MARSDSRERILDAAERLFAEKGVAATSLREIGLLAQANPGSIYFHWKTKAELVRDTDQVVEILTRVSTKTLDNPDDKTREGVRSAVRGTAPKRTGIRIRPEKIVSWDHTKLGGVY